MMLAVYMSAWSPGELTAGSWLCKMTTLIALRRAMSQRGMPYAGLLAAEVVS